MWLRRTRLTLALVVSVGTGGAVACSSFSGEQSTSSGADGATPDATAGGDGAVPSDAGASDSTAASVDAGPPFCSGYADASFCWSFDEGSDYLRGPFLDLYTQKPPVLTDAAKSAPYAVSASPDGTGTSYVRLSGRTATTSIRCDFDLAVDKGPTNGSANAIWITPGGGQPSYALIVSENSGNLSAKTAINSDTQPIANLTTGTWAHVALSVSLGATYHADGFVGTISAPVDKALPEAGAPVSLGNFDVSFGLTFAFQSEWSLRYDNLVCTWN